MACDPIPVNGTLRKSAEGHLDMFSSILEGEQGMFVVLSLDVVEWECDSGASAVILWSWGDAKIISDSENYEVLEPLN